MKDRRLKLLNYLVHSALSIWMFSTAAYILNRSLPFWECVAFGIIVTGGGLCLRSAGQATDN